MYKTIKRKYHGKKEDEDLISLTDNKSETYNLNFVLKIVSSLSFYLEER